jgi:mono/diheme cytochrome c family protein
VLGVPLAMTGYEIGLLLTALAFIAFALVVALVIPRSRPTFPTPYLGAFIAVCAVFFVAQMTAVVLLAEVGEAHDEVAQEEAPGETETTPTATTELTETEPTETEPTETTDTEMQPTATDPDEPTETTPTETEPTETTETETETETTSPPQASGDPVAGRNVFVTAGCNSCHTLADAGASGTIGPNLDESAPSHELVVDRVTNGQGVMPAFEGELTPQQIQDVAAYVSSAPSRATS